MPQKIRKAIFPVGGLGTRFLPATKAMPKEMLPILDKPLIQYAVEEAREAGIEEFIFVTGRGKTVIEDHFDHNYELNAHLKKRQQQDVLETIESCVFDPGQIVFLRQQKPKGLGHAVWCARHLIHDEPFAVILADDFILGQPNCLQQMIPHYKKHTHMAAVMQVPTEDTHKYGILDLAKNTQTINDKLIEAKALVEKPKPKNAPSNYAIVGRYILDSRIFSVLEEQQMGQGNEVQLTDAIQATLHERQFFGHVFQGTRFDCGSKSGMLRATLAVATTHEDIDTPLKKTIKSHLENTTIKEKT